MNHPNRKASSIKTALPRSARRRKSGSTIGLWWVTGIGVRSRRTQEELSERRKAYVDPILSKTLSYEELLAHISETALFRRDSSPPSALLVRRWVYLRRFGFDLVESEMNLREATLSLSDEE